MTSYTCTSRTGARKKRWPNATAANFVADLAQRKDGVLRDTYACPTCDGWHVSTRRDAAGDPISTRKRPNRGVA